MSRKVFLSCVTKEFERYREMLAKDLRRSQVEVRVQEDFVVGRHTTLDKLDEYIKDCDAVIHLVGSATGSPAEPAEVADLLQRYPDLIDKLSPLKGAQLQVISYTQWEAWLALYHRIPCLVFLAEEGSEDGTKQPAPRGLRFVPNGEQTQLQKEHWQRLRLRGTDAGTFQDEQHLCREVLLSVRCIFFPPEFADEDLVQRLPLPLAQLYRRTLNSKTPQERHLAAYYLWEASLKLLGVVTVVNYAEQRLTPDAQLADCLTNLARPTPSYWWEYVRRLVPLLADAGDAGFQSVRDLLLGSSRNDLPRAAGLDAALREALGDSSGLRSSVSLMELCDRLIRYRNQELRRPVLGQRSAAFDEHMGKALLEAFREVMSRLDVLAGHRLLYVAEVRRQPSGTWLIERSEPLGENGRRIESLAVSEAEAGSLLEPERLYLAVASPLTPPRLLHPLLWHDAKDGEMLFLNSPHGQLRTNYLDYTTGRSVDLPEFAEAHREFLSKIFGRIVTEEEVAAWAARSLAEEPPVRPWGESPRTLGEFQLWSELGRGGMGVVYRAWQPSLGRQVALKKLQKTGDAKIESRFAREIRALGRVEHPHLVKIFTSGSADDQWYYAMELLEGTPLSAVCDTLQTSVPSVTVLDLPTWRGTVVQACLSARQAEKPLGSQVLEAASLTQQKGGSPVEPRISENAGGTIAPSQPSPSWVTSQSPKPDRPLLGHNYVEHIAELLRQISEAAHALHEAGIIHRDIKPGNIMVTEDGALAFLIDPGLAKLADEVDGRLTRTRQFVGTLRYASPEQVLAVGGLDRRSDIYSLGATLWELLTLRPLYGGDEKMPTPELMRRIQYQEPERVRKYNPKVPADLDAIVLKCLEKDPWKRYPIAGDLARDLKRFLEGQPVRARPIRSWERTWKWVKRRPVAAGLAVVTVLLVLALVGGVVGLFYHGQLQSALAEAQTEKRKAEKARVEAKRQSALAALYRGMDLASQGLQGEGMLWMVRGLKDSPESDGNLQKRIRTALATTRSTLHLLDKVIAYPHNIVRVARLSPQCPSDPVGGRYVLVGGEDWAARLFDTRALEYSRSLRFGNSVSAGAFSPDGRTFAAGAEDGTVRFGIVPSGEEILPLIKHGAAVKFVAFDRSGKTLLVAGRGKPSLRCYDAVTHLPLPTPRFDIEADLYMAVFSPDGTQVAAAAGRENKALFWDARTGEKLGETGNHPGPVQAVTFCPSGMVGESRLATGCLDGRVRLWDKAGKQTGEIRAHTGSVRGLDFSGDGRFLLSSSEDQTARLWDVAQGRPVGQPFRHRGEVHRAEFSPDGRFALVTGYDGTVQLWRLTLTDAAVKVLSHRSRVSAVAFSPDGQMVLTGARERTRKDGQSQLWGLDGEPLANVPPLPQDGEVLGVAFSPDGRSVLTGGNEGTVRLWNTADGKLRSQWPYVDPSGKPRPVAAVAFSQDGSLLAYGGQGNRIGLRRTSTGAELDAWDANHVGWVWGLAFSPKEDALLSSGTRGVKLWLLQDGRRREQEPRLLGTNEEHGVDVRRAVFSRDGAVILTGGFESKARVWASATGQPRTPWMKHDASILAVALSPDGQRAVTASADHTARLWDATTGVGLKTLPHNGKVQAVAFSPNGKIVATGCDDGTARLWDADQGDELGAVLRHGEPVTCLSFGPDGRRLLTGSDDHTARLWTLPEPLEGTYEQIVAWAQLVTGEELGSEDSLRVLDATEWQGLRSLVAELGGSSP